MLSPSFSSPHISFNLSCSSTSLFNELQTLRKISTSRSFIADHRFPRFRASSFKFPSSKDFSTFDYSESTLDGQSQNLNLCLCPSLLAFWVRSCRTLREVKRIHSIALRRRFGADENTYLHNNLICGYLKLGDLRNAREVFDEMPQRNVVSWTALINGYLILGLVEEASKLFGESMAIGIRPNEKMFVCALSLCGERNDLYLGRQVHAGILKYGHRRINRIVSGAVVKLYARCNDLKNARRAFDETPIKDIVSWTTMISAYSRHRGFGAEAFSLISAMISEGFEPNEFTFCAVLKACGDEKALEFGRQIHGLIVKKGLILGGDVFLGTSLVDMYAKCGEIADSTIVFDAMPRRNTATWTAIVAGHARAGLGSEALVLVRDMIRRRVHANRLTVVSAVRACGAVGPAAEMAGRELHARAVRDPRLGTGLHVGSTLVWFYLRCGAHSAARTVLKTMPERDVVSWTAMISGLAGRAGCEREAVGLLGPMRSDGVEGNDFTASAALKACSRLEDDGLELGRAIHGAASKAAPGGGSLNVFVGSALIHMYSRCGEVGSATRVFDAMGERNEVAWGTMLVGLARNGLCREALGLMYQMRAQKVELDDYVRGAVLNACASDPEFELHGGLM